MMDITHGDLLPCTCGGGKPDVTHMLFSGRVLVDCSDCGLSVLETSERAAVSDWNVFIRARMVAALAGKVA